LLIKRGGPFLAAAARLQGGICPLDTTRDAGRRLTHLGHADAYA
jgi:hypothetical protein